METQRRDGRADNPPGARKAWKSAKPMMNGYARAKKEYSKKFVSAGMCPCRRAKRNVDEVERCISELGLQGIALPSRCRTFPGRPRAMAPVEKIQKLMCDRDHLRSAFRSGRW